MLREKLLVTTALDETILKDVPEYLLLGEWCILYNNNKFWAKKKFQITSYHWDDRNKLKSDHYFLKKLYDEILNQLVDELNDCHNLNHSKKYWILIVGPWLANYLSVMFDRWEILDKFFQENKKCSTVRIVNKKLPIPNNYDDSINLYLSDEWNHLVFSDIIEEFYLDKVIFIDHFSSTDINLEADLFNRKSLLINAISFFDRLIKKLTYNNKYFFFKSYFKINKLIRFNFFLNQLPRLYFFDFNYNYNKFQKRGISKILGKFGIDNQFTQYIRKRIYADLPFSYLENFDVIWKYTNSLNYNPEIIFTANAHFNDEVFKIWAAEMVSRGKKLILSHHGGAFPPSFCNLYHEEECSNIYTTWFKEFNAKQKQLPPNKISAIEINKNGYFCSIIGFESTRYTLRAEAAPLTHQCISCYDQVVTFCHYLDKDIFKNLRIRPYESMGWGLKDRYVNEFGSKFIDAKNSYKTFLSNSKILIVTYPQTTFSEAFSSGKPTILLYKNELFELIETSNEIVNELIEAKIIFIDPEKAANHINNIWSNPNAWWESEIVIEARNKFYKVALNINENWNEEWINFFKMQI
jgi:putative transferase (TIGR04331 family)